jgi:hypothetical protein
MPDDVSGLMPEFERNLARANGDPIPEEEEDDVVLPRAKVKMPAISMLWIRWLPLAIMLFGLSFVVWTIVMIVQVGQYHDGLTTAKNKTKEVQMQLESLKKEVDALKKQQLEKP